MADSSALRFCLQDDVNLELSQRVEPESMQGQPGTEAVAQVWASEVLDFSLREVSGWLETLGQSLALSGPRCPSCSGREPDKVICVGLSNSF